MAALMSGCAAMAPAASGPWPPIPSEPVAEQPDNAAADAAPLAGPPSPQTTPAPATVEPEAAPPPQVSSSPALLLSVPEGWRPPNDAELDGPLVVSRGDSPSLYLAATGDFNGDGRADRAVLLVSTTADQYGVFIEDGRGQAAPLLVGSPGVAVKELGLESFAGGALRFFRFGGSRFLITWDGAAYAVTPEG